jgi:glucan biosynthesis protein C
MSKPERRYDIDWLRSLAMLAVFLFHCARLFDYDDWHVKNDQLTLGMSIFIGILVQWIMPIFFILSAESSYFSLRFRSAGHYVRERFKRLFIPLVFGIFAHVPFQVYFERVSHSQFSGSFIEFFPHYFDGLYGFGGNFAWMGLHLWFLLVLLIFSMLVLPLFLFLRKDKVQRVISRAAVFFKRPGAILLFALPLALAELVFRPDGLGRREMGGWNIFVYLVIFIYGYLLASDIQFKAAIEKHRIASLVMAVITTVIMIFWRLSENYPSWGYSFGYILAASLRAFNSWFWLTAILGFGSRYLNIKRGILRYTNRAVLPFYALHQTIILAIGFYVVRWEVSVALKYIIISLLSFATIMLIYDLVIKRVGLFRFLFGMKRHGRKTV